MNLGNAIKLCRTQRNLSQAELARSAGISVSYLSLLERGKRDPTMSTVESIAEALTVPVSILVFLSADPDELHGVSPEVAEKLSSAVLRLIWTSNDADHVH